MQGGIFADIASFPGSNRSKDEASHVAAGVDPVSSSAVGHGFTWLQTRWLNSSGQWGARH